MKVRLVVGRARNEPSRCLKRKYHKGWLLESMLTNLPVPYDLCVGVPIACLLTVG